MASLAADADAAGQDGVDWGCMCVVIDTGSDTCKIGHAGDEFPRAEFKTVVGRPRAHGVMVGMPIQDDFVGDEAYFKRGVLSLKCPLLDHGIVNDWDDMEKIWSHAFFNEYGNGYRDGYVDQPVLLMEPPLNPKANRERMTQIMFDEINVQAVCLITQPVLSLFALGRTTGCVVDLGDRVAHVAPVYQGYLLPHALVRLNFSGRDLTTYLMEMLTERGCHFTYAHDDIARDMKAKLTYVALDFDAEMEAAEASTTLGKSYELPTGNTIEVRSERFRCPEVLFRPSLIGKDVPGIHECICQSIAKCFDDNQKLWGSIVLSGGSTLFPGMSERLTKELTALVPPTVEVNVIALAGRKNLAWLGGSILAENAPNGFDANFNPTSSSIWITRREYDEVGPSIVHRKCPASAFEEEAELSGKSAKR